MNTKKWLAVLRSDATDDLRGPDTGGPDGPRIAVHVFPEGSPRHDREIALRGAVPMVAASFEWTLVPGPDMLQ